MTAATYADMATATNLTRPDGIVAERFVKNATTETFAWYHQDLEEGTTVCIMPDAKPADVFYIIGLLTDRGWR